MAASKKPTLSALLPKLREELGMTQEQFATHLGVSTRTVSRWEQGEVTLPDAAQRMAIARSAQGTSTANALGKLWTGAVVGALLPGIVPGIVASAATGWLARPKTPVDPKFLHDAASELDVSWDRFKFVLLSALVTARDIPLTLDELIRVVIETREPEA